jgi:hypothetical protein
LAAKRLAARCRATGSPGGGWTLVGQNAVHPWFASPPRCREVTCLHQPPIRVDLSPWRATISGTTPKTVKRVIARHDSGEVQPVRAPREYNYDGVAELVAERVEKTHRWITAKVAAGGAGRGICGAGAELAPAGRGAKGAVASGSPSWSEVMARPSRYRRELRERAVRMVGELWSGVATRVSSRRSAPGNIRADVTADDATTVLALLTTALSSVQLEPTTRRRT